MLDAGRNIGRHVRVLRERKNWTYESTAERMTSIGVPMQGSTIYKIEKAAAPRQVSAVELAGFALIFEVSMETLAQAPEVVEMDALRERVETWQRALVAHLESNREMNEATRAMLEAASATPDLEQRGELGQWLTGVLASWGEPDAADHLDSVPVTENIVTTAGPWRVAVWAERQRDAS